MKFLGSWTGEPTENWPTGTRVDVTFEPVPSGRVYLRDGPLPTLREKSYWRTPITLFRTLGLRKFGRPFGLASSSGMVGYWQVNPAGELMQFEGRDARLTRKLMGDDQFWAVGTSNLRQEFGKTVITTLRCGG